ncbi:uncharacterized protein LOC144641561 [Oculina patagonica]
MVSCDWFNLMLSIPLRKPMTRAALFAQWSSIIAYNILGLTILAVPQMWKEFLQLEFSGRTEGYFRLQAIAQFELGFLYVIFARSKFNVPGGIPIRGPVLSKIVFVASFMVPQYLNGSLPLAYAVFYLSLDTLIAGCTFVIWYSETENASAIQLAKDMMKLTFSGLPRRKSSVVVVICGAIQVAVALIFVIKPSYIHNFLRLDPFQGHAVGLLSAYFFLLLVHGTLSTLGGTADGVSFNIACAFYRLAMGIPLLITLAVAGHIEVYLAVFAASLDLIFAVVIIISFCLEGIKIEELSPGKNK